MQVQPYLFFGGRCEEALEFYKKALSTKADMVMHYKDAPKDAQPTTERYGGMAPPLDKVIHAAFRVGGTQVLASDDVTGGKTNFKGFGLSVSVANNAVAEHTFKALGDDSHATMPMSETFFAHTFDMVTDHFGIAWIVATPRLIW